MVWIAETVLVFEAHSSLHFVDEQVVFVVFPAAFGMLYFAVFEALAEE